LDEEWWKQVPPLTLDREGRWFDRGVRVTNPRLAEFLLTHLVRGEDGRYLVAVGRDRRYVEVEDAPYRALGIEVAGGPDASERLLVRLNDGSLEPFDPATFWIGPDGVPYCLVKAGRHKARFTPESYRQLSAFITEEAGSGRYLLQVGSHRITVPTEAQ
jgi:hypothetical protein